MRLTCFSKANVSDAVGFGRVVHPTLQSSFVFSWKTYVGMARVLAMKRFADVSCIYLQRELEKVSMRIRNMYCQGLTTVLAYTIQIKMNIDVHS